MPTVCGHRLPRHRRRCRAHRDHDHSGISGVGVVADGAQFPDGTVALRWRGPHASTVLWASLDDAIAVHGHNGATRVVWGDNLAHELAILADHFRNLLADNTPAVPGDSRIVPLAEARVAKLVYAVETALARSTSQAA